MLDSCEGARLSAATGADVSKYGICSPMHKISRPVDSFCTVPTPSSTLTEAMASLPVHDLSNVIVPTGASWEEQIEDDMDSEQEIYPSSAESGSTTRGVKRTADDMLTGSDQRNEQLKADIAKASKAVTERTHDEYMRYVSEFIGQSLVRLLKLLFRK